MAERPYMHVITVQLKPGTQEEAIRRYKSDILPLARKRAAFIRSYLIARKDEITIISMWRACRMPSQIRRYVGMVRDLRAGRPGLIHGRVEAQSGPRRPTPKRPAARKARRAVRRKSTATRRR
jgi:hypothetical protein